jgi:hypothetical protein
MNTSPLPSTQWAPNFGRTLPAPRFSGPGDSLSNLVGFIDGNRMVQLLSTDGIGMLCPRTGLALKYRGADDARETFLRELSGLIGNIFMAGWAGYAAIRLMSDTVNVLNPKGIPGRAMIKAPHLDAFGKLYMDELRQAQNPAEARENFVKKLLGGVASSDREMSIEGRLAALLQTDAESRKKMLGQMRQYVQQPQKLDLPHCENLMNQMRQLNGKSKGKLQGEEKQAQRKLREKFSQHFLKAGWGKLSPDHCADLSGFFKRKSLRDSIGSTHLHQTIPLDDLAKLRVLEKQKRFAQAQGFTQVVQDIDALLQKPNRIKESACIDILRRNGFNSEKEFMKERLALSLSQLGHDAPLFQEAVDQKALYSGLTSSVHLNHQLGSGEMLKISGKRSVILQEVKHFLEQFADRAHYEATATLPEHHTWGDLQAQIKHALLGKNPKSSWWNKLLPSREDGLITAAQKAKGIYVGVALTVCIMFAGACTFYNNYLTMRKHNGKIFFPGEGLLSVPGMAFKPNGTPIAGNMNGTLPAVPAYHPLRNIQGGIIA